MSKHDRAMRSLAAFIMAVLNITGIVDSPENILVWIVTGILAITALAGNCPLYSLFGINTLTGKRTV